MLPFPSKTQISSSVPILKNPQPIYLPQYERPCLTPTKHGQNCDDNGNDMAINTFCLVVLSQCELSPAEPLYPLV